MRFFLILLICFVGIINTHAGESKKQKAWSILGSISCSSLKRLSEDAKKLKVPLPPFLNTKFIERQFSFIGAGNLAEDKCIGIFFVGGKGIAHKDMVFFVLPLKNNGAAMQFAQKGVPYKKTKDTFVLGGQSTFRVTKDYLLFGAFSEAIAHFDINDLTESFKGNTRIFNAKVDLKSMRKIAPQLIDAAIKSLDKEGEVSDNESAAGRMGEKKGKEMVKSFINRLEFANLSLELNKDDSLHLDLDVNLFKLNLKNADRVFLDDKRSSISFSNGLFNPKELIGFFNQVFDKAYRLGYSKDELKTMSKNFLKLGHFLWLGSSTRVSYKNVNNELAVLVVKKLKSKNELTLYVKSLVESLKVAQKISEEPDLLKLENKKSFYRLHFLKYNYTEFILDFYEENGFGYCVFSELGVLDPKALFSKPALKKGNIANVSIDLFQLLSDFRGIRGNKIFKADKDSYREFFEILKGAKPVSIDFSAANSTAKISFDVNKKIVALVAKGQKLQDLSDDDLCKKRIAACTRKINKNPGIYQLYFDRAKLYISQNDLDKAIGDLEKAQSINPATSKILDKLMDTHLLKFEYEKALKYAKVLEKQFKHLALSPYFMSYEVGVVKGDTSLLKSSKSDIQKVLKKRTHKTIYVKIMEYLVDEIDQKTLLALSLKESKGDKDILAETYYFIALKEMEKKDHKQARFYFNKCIDEKSEEPIREVLLAKEILKKL